MADSCGGWHDGWDILLGMQLPRNFPARTNNPGKGLTLLEGGLACMHTLPSVFHWTLICSPPLSAAPTAAALQGAEHNVMVKVGVNPGFVMQQSRGVGGLRGNTRRSEQQAEQERICRRFWAALILTDLIQEVGCGGGVWVGWGWVGVGR